MRPETPKIAHGKSELPPRSRSRASASRLRWSSGPRHEGVVAEEAAEEVTIVLRRAEADDAERHVLLRERISVWVSWGRRTGSRPGR